MSKDKHIPLLNCSYFFMYAICNKLGSDLSVCLTALYSSTVFQIVEQIEGGQTCKKFYSVSSFLGPFYCSFLPLFPTL